MYSVTERASIHSDISSVWRIWDRFGSIDEFNPNLSSSALLKGSSKTGLGAERRCDLADGKNHVLERIIEYIPESKMVVDIYGGTVPLRNAQASIELLQMGPNQTDVIFTMHFEPKMGWLGKLMVPMMKPQLGKSIAALLHGAKTHVEAGEVSEAA